MILKTLWLSVLLLASCASWKQKDFEKSLEKSPDPTPEVTKEAAPILEKFEVKDVKDGPQPAAPVEAKKVASAKKKTETKKPRDKKIPEKKIEAPVVKGPPADYPEELNALNEKGKKVWEQYEPNHHSHIGEKIFLDIHYLGMTVGKIMVTNQGKKMIDNKEVWHFHARFKSAPFYSSIYELDDTVDTYVTTDKFQSLKYTVIQRESKVEVDDIQLFDHEGLKVYWLYRQERSGKKKNKKEEKYIPYYSIDPFSSLFLYQGLPLKNGDVYEIPVVNKGKVLIMRAKVEGRETIETETGVRKAIRLQATTAYSGDKLKSGDITFWFSDDERRSLLKAQAKISLGSVTADIVKE
jgi:hypothetical protein